MIKVIDLRSECSTNPIFVNFNRQAYAIPTLYVKSLPKFDSKKINTCLIILHPHNNFPEKPNIQGFADFYLYFNFDKYFLSSDTEKKMMQLQAVHQGMLGIAVEQGWNTEPFEIAYQACLDADLVLNTPLKKRKMSPNRKQYLSIFAHCDLYHYKITWTVSDKKGIILQRGPLFSEDPSFLAMGYRLNFHWIDDEHFIVESNYKGLISDTWEVDILNGTVLVTSKL